MQISHKSKSYLHTFLLFFFLYISIEISVILTIIILGTYLYTANKRIKNEINDTNVVTKDQIIKFKINKEKEIIEGISPFHLLLYLFITSFVWFLKFLDSPEMFYLFCLFFFFYSIQYYKTLAKYKKITFFESIKQDLPDFALPDMNFFHILIFLIIASPFLYFFGLIIFEIIIN